MRKNAYINKFLFVFLLSFIILIGDLGYDKIYANETGSSFHISKESQKKKNDEDYYLDKYREEIDIAHGNLELFIGDVLTRYYKEIDINEVIKGIYSGVYLNLDNHSDFIFSEQKNELENTLSGSFAGVGIKIDNKEGITTIKEVVAQTPASKSDFMVGDIIKEINFENVRGWTLEEVVHKIRGEEGAPIVFKLSRIGRADFEVRVLREKISIKTATHNVVNGVDILTITTFSDNTFDEVKEILKSNKFKNGLIIDLRNNPGGYLHIALKIVEEFLPKDKELLKVEFRGEITEKFVSEKSGYKMPIAVLINEKSASASEVLAGILQQYGRAKIIGKTSYGKGTIQDIVNLTNGDAIKMTIGEYILPNDYHVDSVGIKPDIEVDFEKSMESLAKNYMPMNSLSKSKLGSLDIDTKGLQQRLKFFGYDVPVGGKFDLKTQEALKEIQKNSGLEVTGELKVEDKIKIQEMFVEKLALNYDFAMETAVKILKDK